jgi:uroporphyrinogen decarboxylase
MNGYERIISAMKGERPDNVPVMLHNFMMAAEEAGYTQAEFRSDPQKIANAFIQSIEKYRYDGIMVDIDTVTLAGALGVPVDFPENEPARTNRGCLADLEEVNDLDTPDISRNERIQIWLEAVRIMVRYFDREILIRGNCDQAPFSLASMMRTPAIWMLDLLNPESQELVHRLLEHCLETGQQFMRLMADTGAHMLSQGDSPAGPEMISPEMYRDFAMPYEARMVEEAHRLGLSYILHICGDTGLILDDMVNTGSDGLEIDHKTDASIARDAINNRCTFVGNVDPSGVLALGDQKAVAQKTQEVLNVFATTPRFILNAGCAIPSSTPPENIMTMIRTAREFVPEPKSN